jgi:VCBS repeat-containing protein
MTKKMKTLSLVGCGALTIALAMGAQTSWAQGGNEPGAGSQTTTRGELVTKTFTVEDVDHANRVVTLKAKGNEHVMVNVPQDVQGFDKLKKGEKVDVDYYQSMAISLAPKGTPLAPTQMQEGTGPTEKGVAGARQVTASAKIVSVNHEENTVVLKGANGKMDTVKVDDPALQQKLAQVKPGQVVQMTYTQAVAAAIRPQQK